MGAQISELLSSESMMSARSWDQELIYFGDDCRARADAANAGCQIGIVRHTASENHHSHHEAPNLSQVGLGPRTKIDFTLGGYANVLGEYHVGHGNSVDAVREYRVSKSLTPPMLHPSGCRLVSAFVSMSQDS